MKAYRNESGFSSLVALTTLACLAAVAIAFTQAMTVRSKAARDAASNSDIASFHQRLQKLLSTEWSCTLSLRGSNYNLPIILMDPVNPGTVLAEDGLASGPFWSLASLKMENVHEVEGRAGVYSGDLNLSFRKVMEYQTGSPMVDRVITDVWFEAAADGQITRCYPNPIAQAVASAACKSIGGSWTAGAAFGSQCEAKKGHGNPADGEPAPSPTPAPTEQAGTAPAPSPTPTETPNPAPTEPASEPTPVATSTPAPSPTPAPSLPSALCFDVNAGVIAVPNSQMVMTGNGTVGTGVYLMNGSKLSLTGNASVEGMVYQGTGATYSMTKNTSIAHITTGDLAALNSDLNALSAAGTALVASTTLTSLDESRTLESSGRTVVLVTGDLNLTGNNTLTLSGTASDSFVINVVGKITVAGNGQIVLTGGIPARNVVFNNIGIGNEMVLSGNGSISGTFLALQRGVQVSGNGHLTGAVVAGGGVNTKITITGNGLAMTPQPFCTN